LVIVDVPIDDADEAVAIAFELGAEGVEQRDESTLLTGPAAGMATLVISFADPDLAKAAMAELDPSWHPRLSEIVGDSWRDEWKKHFLPFRLTDRITIRPPWEAYEPRGPSEIVLELEPGRAFGTGLHATTALVARALEAHRDELQKAVILDVGTGSGILALVALALGAARARAIDTDSDAVAVTLENARRNALESRIEADTCPVSAITETFDFVTANIEARILVGMAADLEARLRPGAILILSGILGDQADAPREAFSSLELIEAPKQDEWVALVLRVHSDGPNPP